MIVETLLILLMSYYAPTPLVVIIGHISILRNKKLSRFALLSLWTVISILFFLVFYNYGIITKANFFMPKQAIGVILLLIALLNVCQEFVMVWSRSGRPDDELA
jgi:hypothetical protein